MGPLIYFIWLPIIHFPKNTFLRFMQDTTIGKNNYYHIILIIIIQFYFLPSLFPSRTKDISLDPTFVHLPKVSKNSMKIIIKYLKFAIKKVKNENIFAFRYLEQMASILSAINYYRIIYLIFKVSETINFFQFFINFGCLRVEL